MNSDELGAKGENRFAEWCADAGLTCNKAVRDRAGWDFLVDFPHQASSQSLDHRLGPLSCVIQVKTVLSTTRSVRLRVDMAERLAKEVKPSFIVVLVVKGTDVVGADVFHIRGPHLEFILRRLRQAELDGNAGKLGSMTLSFARSEGQAIAPSGAALRATLAAVMSDGMDAYAAAKDAERRSLGYGEHVFSGSFHLTIEDPSEVLDFFLGHRQNVPITLSAITETRFGIDLPHGTPGEALISIVPAPWGRGMIRVSAPAFDMPFAEPAEVFYAHLESDGFQRFEWRTKGFRVSVTSSRAGKKIDLYWCWKASETTLRDWAAYARLRAMLHMDDAWIEISLDDGPNPGRHRQRLTSPPPAVADLGSHLVQFAAALGLAEDLVRRAGAHQDQMMSLEDLLRAKPAVDALGALTHGGTTALDCTADGENGLPSRVVMAGIVPWGKAWLGWHGVMDVGVLRPLPALALELSGFRLSGVREYPSEEAYRKDLPDLRRHANLRDIFELFHDGGRALARLVDAPRMDTRT